MRLTIIILIAVLSIGSIVISLGFLTSQEYIDVPEITSQYEKLESYKNDLEKINQQNQKILNDLEKINQQNQKILNDLESQIKNSDDINLEKINEEINVIKQVIEENTAELEQVITKLSQMETEP